MTVTAAESLRNEMGERVFVVLATPSVSIADKARAMAETAELLKRESERLSAGDFDYKLALAAQNFGDSVNTARERLDTLIALAEHVRFIDLNTRPIYMNPRNVQQELRNIHDNASRLARELVALVPESVVDRMGALDLSGNLRVIRNGKEIES